MPQVFLKPTDILALRLECAKCGTAVSVKLNEWPGIEACPTCHSNWDPRAIGPSRVAKDFIITLQQLLRDEGNAPYQVKLEIEQPRT